MPVSEAGGADSMQLAADDVVMLRAVHQASARQVQLARRLLRTLIFARSNDALKSHSLAFFRQICSHFAFSYSTAGKAFFVNPLFSIILFLMHTLEHILFVISAAFFSSSHECTHPKRTHHFSNGAEGASCGVNNITNTLLTHTPNTSLNTPPNSPH